MSELTPITRKETFLAKVGGQNVVTPTPITREETFLQAIIDNGSGGGGGTGGGVLVATLTEQEIEGEYYIVADKTYTEIISAMRSSGAVFVDDITDATYVCVGSKYIEGLYKLISYGLFGAMELDATEEDPYPKAKS